MAVENDEKRSGQRRRWFAGGVLAGAGLAIAGAPAAARRRLWKRLRGRVRYLTGHATGLAYRFSGRHPTADVTDDILADRIRSTLGPLEKSLDIPRVHVTVRGHEAILHGVVGTEDEGMAVERETSHVSGVRRVESHLHVGMARGDTRPSAGMLRRVPSEARTRLLAAAAGAGAGEAAAERAVRAVFSILAERIPGDELEDLISHLPSDVKVMTVPARRIGKELRTPAEFGAAVGRAAGLADAETGERVARAVLDVVRELVPEERADVSSVLPKHLKEMWTNRAKAV